jgi:hypothetical protein
MMTTTMLMMHVFSNSVCHNNTCPLEAPVDLSIDVFTTFNNTRSDRNYAICRVNSSYRRVFNGQQPILDMFIVF